jgi:hypothetical protein
LNINFIIAIAILGILSGVAGVHYFKEAAPVTTPVSMNYSPYQNSIAATGVIELPPASLAGTPAPYLIVRCFVNQILVPSLPVATPLEATLYLRGGSFEGLPLEFVRIEPAIVSDTESANGTKALPIIFKFEKPANYNIYPGQSVDVYIKGNAVP